jgi:flagellar L-ring protein FlgH
VNAALRWTLCVIAPCLTACAAQHIQKFTPRQRDYQIGRYEKGPTAVSTGSIWQEGSRSLVADFRASHVGDLVTIRIDESPNATGDADTRLNRDSSMSFGAPQMFGLSQAIQRAHPDINMGDVFNVLGSSNFQGTGSTTRSSRVQAAMAVRVKKALPNGDLFVEGTKVLMVNEEELHIYVSGVIRPEDIANDNSVNSSVIADAQIEFVGRGVLSDNQSQGWLMRLLAAINPL